MSGEDLVNGLAGTGTGEAKLRAARAWLEANPKAEAGKLLRAMSLGGHWPEGTVDKANALMGGSYVPPSPHPTSPAHKDEDGQGVVVNLATPTDAEAEVPMSTPRQRRRATAGSRSARAALPPDEENE